MNTILALDTSGPSLSVALLSDGKLLYECTQQNGLTHSDSLMPLVEAALASARLDIARVDCIAPVVGPGSFTGVRIGVSTAKGLANALRIPCIGVNALEALAAGVWPFAGLVCPMQDARAGQVYAAAFRDGERVMQDEACKLADFLRRIQDEGRCCFVGDGAVAHRAEIAEAVGEDAVFAPPQRMSIHAGTVAWLALRAQGEAVDGSRLAPYYLRAPQAERERLAKEAANG